MEENNKNPLMNIETTSPDQELSIGQLVQAYRQKKNLTIKQMSQKTKISTTQLEHLENDSLDLLPNKAYVIGYLKSLAKLLNFDLNEALKLLNASYEIANPDNTPKQEAPQRPSKSKSVGFIITILTVSAIAVIILINVLSSTSNQHEMTDSSTPDTEPAIAQTNPSISNPISPETQIAVTATPEITAQEDETPPSVEPTPTEQAPITVQNQEITPKQPSTDQTVNKVTFRPLPAETYDLQTENTEKLIQKYLPGGEKRPLIRNKQNLYITAYQDDTWITYKTDSDPVKRIILQKGNHLSITGDLIQIFFGNINAAILFLNNHPLKIHAQSGVKSLIFPKEEGSNFVLPLFVFDEKTGMTLTAEEFIKKHKVDN